MIRQICPQSQSQIELAQDAVVNKRTELVPHMSSFTVQSNNRNHWVTSFQYEHSDINHLDSNLGRQSKACINYSLKVQLAQIYGCRKASLTIKIPRIQQ